MHDLYVGLISGTSVDSVDDVVVDFSKNKIKILKQYCFEIPYLIKKEILDNTKSSTINKKEITHLDKELGELFSRVINDLLKKTNLNHKQIKAIGSHGQTIKHSPNSKPPFSLQIGDPSIIAKKCKIPTVGDFRSEEAFRLYRLGMLYSFLYGIISPLTNAPLGASSSITEFISCRYSLGS